MTDSHIQHRDIIQRYVEGWSDFKQLVIDLIGTGLRPREAYAIAIAEEQKYMQAIAKRGWEKQDG